MDILFGGDLSFSWMPPLTGAEKIKEKTFSILNKNYRYELYGDKISADLKNEINSVDFFCVNLECVLSNKGVAVEDKKYQLNADPKFVHSLKNIGINVVTLANNHILDFGIDALNETISNLENENINHLGIRFQNETLQKPLILTAGSEKIALFNFVEPSIIDPSPEVYFNEKTHPFPLEEKTVLDSLDSFKEDIPKVVILHFGTEWCFIESEQQQNLCKLCIDHGAEAVIGHHTHLSGRMEEYKGKPIFYGLGNFLMPLPNFSAERAKKRPLVRLSFDKNRLKDYEIIPISTGENGFPIKDNSLIIESYNNLYLPDLIQPQTLTFDSLCNIETSDINVIIDNQKMKLEYFDTAVYNPDVVLGRLPVSHGFRTEIEKWCGTSFSFEPIGNQFLTSNLTFLKDSAELEILFRNLPKTDKIYFIESTPPWFKILNDFTPLKYSLFINEEPSQLDKLNHDKGWNIFEIITEESTIESLKIRFSGVENKYSYHLWRILGV